MMTARIRIRTDRSAGLLANVLRPESDDELSRSSMRVHDEGSELVMDIEAEDVVALRAAVNSYLRWTKLAMDTTDAMEGLE